MSYEMYSVLPPEDSTFQQFEKFKKQFGQESSVLVLGFRGDQIFQLEEFNAWRKLCSNLKTVDGVDEVLAIPTVGNLIKNQEEVLLSLM